MHREPFKSSTITYLKNGFIFYTTNHFSICLSYYHLLSDTTHFKNHQTFRENKQKIKF